MKQIYLISFRGLGSNSEFSDQALVFRLGHVGMAFEGTPRSILGFHPTAEAIERQGGEAQAHAHLLAKGTLDGRLFEDYDMFAHAYQLVQRIPDYREKLTVYAYAVAKADAEFDAIRQQVLEWYNFGTTFTYGFPFKPPSPDRNNCASFPGKLGLPVFDGVGQIKTYMRMMPQERTLWTPED